MDIAERIRLALVERQDVRLVYLFGSTAAGTARRGSDADIAILFDEVPAPDMLNLLSERLGAAAKRPVDLVVLMMSDGSGLPRPVLAQAAV